MAMSIERTRATVVAYAQAVIGRQDYTRYFSNDVVYTEMDTGCETRGPAAVAQVIDADLRRASDVTLRNLIVGEGQAAAEATLVNPELGSIPYCVAYDLADDKITALRIYSLGARLR